MTPAIALGIGASGLVVGTAVGAVGIGGVLLVPVLTLLLGIEVKSAIAAALLAYLPSGALAVTLYALRGSVAWREAGLIGLGALPASWAGALVASHAPASLLEAAIGLLLVAGGLYTLRPPRPASAVRRILCAPVLMLLGAVTGFGCAMTGAGGAFILIPLLLLLDTPVLPAIGLGQAIVVPIAGVASISNIAAGNIDLPLSAGLAVALSAGIAIGTPIAHSLPQQKLRRLLTVIVLVAGSAMLVRVALR